MSLATNVSDLATAVGTKIKESKTLINGNAADLSALSTTDKTSLLAAINEVAGAVATAAGIDDGSVSTSTTYSSTKTMAEIASASTADRNRANHTGSQTADTITDGTTNKAFTATERTKLTGIATGATANATDAALRARSSHTGTQTADTISDFEAEVTALINSVLDLENAPELLNSINELASAIGDDENFAATITTALGNRVRVDASQSFTSPQQAQGRSNIGAAASADVGDTSTNFVTAFNAALV